MSMKKISCLFIMILFSTLALSKDYYFITGINNNKIETGITVSTASLDEDDDDMFFTIGYNYSDNLGIDISFFETGDATLSGDNGDRFTLAGTEYEFIVNNAKISVSSENIAVGLRPKAKLSEELDVFGRVGYHFYEATASASGDGITTASLTASPYQVLNSKLKKSEVIITNPIAGPKAIAANKLTNFIYNRDSS